MFISQVYFCAPSGDVKRLIATKRDAQALLIKANNQLFIIDKDRTLTDEQKKHRKEHIKNKLIKPLEKLIAAVPDYNDSIFVVESFEYGLNDRASLGVKSIFKYSKGDAKNKKYLVELEVFNKFQLYQAKTKSASSKSISRSISFSPKIIFIQNNLVEYELRLISFNSTINKKKKFSRFFESQLGARLGEFGVKYNIDITNGIRFDNGFLAMVQSFWMLDLNNPLEIYRDTVKNQISVAKQIPQTDVTLQVGYFNHTSAKFRSSLSSGVFTSLWCYF
jgi:hypothetical protein